MLVVASRLPVSAVRRGEDSWSLEISGGGLVTALLGVKEFEARWIGWAGVNVPDEIGHKALTKALAEKRCIPVFLDEEIVHQYYNGYCNNILWPLFHYLAVPQEDRLATTRSFQSQFAAYKRANTTFADVVNSHYEKGPGTHQRIKRKVCWLKVPTRTDVPEYQKLTSHVHEIVGRINGRFRTLTAVSIHHLDRSLDFHALCALYAVTDVALVTSLRDGMNLVSYEFVACQDAKKGVLILSEFAGAAQSLGAEAILALNMPAEEREKRHCHNFHHVTMHTAQEWAETFSSNRLLILGFNATLTEPVDSPGSRGDQIKEMELKLYPELKEPLTALCNDPKTTVVVLSGSNSRVLDKNFGEYDMWLAAENGMFLRHTNGDWMTTTPEHLNMEWVDSVKHVFEYFTERTPRSHFETRDTSLVWNYKYADIEFGRLQARDMLQHLWTGPISNASVDVVQGSRSVEVRVVGVTKETTTSLVLLAGLVQVLDIYLIHLMMLSHF
ncbi:hypothetical protein REPUB_Repub18cG0112000 [Reevesia pubescens]